MYGERKMSGSLSSGYKGLGKADGLPHADLTNLCSSNRQRIIANVDSDCGVVKGFIVLFPSVRVHSKGGKGIILELAWTHVVVED